MGIGAPANCPIVLNLPEASIPECVHLGNFLYASPDLRYLEFVNNVHAFAVWNSELYVENVTPFPLRRVSNHSASHIEVRLGQLEVIPDYRVRLEKAAENSIATYICVVSSAEACAGESWTVFAKKSSVSLRQQNPPRQDVPRSE